MKNRFFLLITCSVFSANLLFPQQDFQGIDGINRDNYPYVDGSTSTNPLNYIVAAKLLNLEYEWTAGTGGKDVIFTNQGEISWDFRGKLQCSQTHEAIINLNDYPLFTLN